MPRCPTACRRRSIALADHTTTYSYRQDANGNFLDYGDYHQPTTITETGDLSRTTSRTYTHLGNSPTTPSYLVGKLAQEQVTVGGETFTESWTYDDGSTPSPGFLRSHTRYGITTTFTPSDDGGGYVFPHVLGNVASVTNNGHTTSFTYDWGVVKDVKDGREGDGLHVRVRRERAALSDHGGRAGGDDRLRARVGSSGLGEYRGRGRHELGYDASTRSDQADNLTRIASCYQLPRPLTRH